MKITRFDVTPLNNRGLLLQVETDAGLTGLGAPMNYEHGRTVERAILDMGEYLIGRDPLQIEDHWQTLYRSSYSRQMPILLAALSGIEMACLDILGKTANLPVWKLLGGSVRERIRVYGSAGGATPEQAAQAARQRVEQGFTALKTTPFPNPVRPIETPAGIERVVSHIAAMREAVGPAIDIAIDFHRATSPALAKVLLRELEPLKAALRRGADPFHRQYRPPAGTDALDLHPHRHRRALRHPLGLPRIVRAQGRGHRPTRHPPLRRHPRNEEDRRPSRSPRDRRRAPQRRRPPRHRRLRTRDGRHAQLPHHGIRRR